MPRKRLCREGEALEGLARMKQKECDGYKQLIQKLSDPAERLKLEMDRSVLQRQEEEYEQAVLEFEGAAAMWKVHVESCPDCGG